MGASGKILLASKRFTKGCCIVEITRDTGNIHKCTPFSNFRDNIPLEPLPMNCNGNLSIL